jgi:hypothetical protein
MRQLYAKTLTRTKAEPEGEVDSLSQKRHTFGQTRLSRCVSRHFLSVDVVIVGSGPRINMGSMVQWLWEEFPIASQRLVTYICPQSRVLGRWLD